MTSSVLPSNRWVLVTAVVYSDMDMRIFFDGVQQMAVRTSVGGPVPYTAAPALIGRFTLDIADESRAVRLDEVAVFSRALADAEVEALYRRGVLHLTYRARSCAVDDCLGSLFVGLDGVNSAFSDLQNTTPGLPSFELSALGPGRFFQYEAVLNTDDSSLTPALLRVDIDGRY